MDSNQSTSIHEFPNFDEDEPQFSPRQEYKRKRLLFSPPRRVVPTSGASLFLQSNYIVMPQAHESILQEKKHSKTPQNISEEQPDVFIRKQGHTRPVTPSRRLFSPPNGVTTTRPVLDIVNHVQENHHHEQQEYIRQETPTQHNSIVSPEAHAIRVAATANEPNCHAVSQDSPVHEVHISIPEYANSPCGNTDVDQCNYFDFQENHIEMNADNGNMDNICHQSELPTNQQPQPVQQDTSQIFPLGCKENLQDSLLQTEQCFNKETVPSNFVRYTEQQFDRLWNEIETLRDTVHKQNSQIKLQNELIQKLQVSVKSQTKRGSSAAKKNKSSEASSSSSSSSAASDNCNLSSDSDDDGNDEKKDRPNKPNDVGADANIHDEKISATDPLGVATPNKTNSIKMISAPSKLIPCSLCPREYKTGMALTCHMSKIHGIKVQPETALPPQPQRRTSPATVCKYCDKIFHNQIRCEQHIKVVHGRLRIQCDRCEGYFSDHQKLKEHLKEHDGLPEPTNSINPLYCTVKQGSRKKCKESFTSKQSLRHHLWRKHFITGEDAEKNLERAVYNSKVLRTPQGNSSVSGIPSISSQ